MTEKKEPQKTTNGTAPAPKVRRVFGLDGDTLIDRLDKKRVRVEVSTGAVLQGVLVGATPYTVTLLVGDEKTPTVVNKGQIVTIQPLNGAAQTP